MSKTQTTIWAVWAAVAALLLMLALAPGEACADQPAQPCGADAQAQADAPENLPGGGYSEPGGDALEEAGEDLPQDGGGDGSAAPDGGTAESARVVLVHGASQVQISLGESMTLAEILDALGIEAEPGDVSFSDESALALSGEGAGMTVAPAEGATATVYVTVAGEQADPVDPEAYEPEFAEGVEGGPAPRASAPARAAATGTSGYDSGAGYIDFGYVVHIGDEVNHWNYPPLLVNGSYSYCTSPGVHYPSGITLTARDAASSFSQEMITRLALMREYIWSGNYVGGGTPIVQDWQKYAVMQVATWLSLYDYGYTDWRFFWNEDTVDRDVLYNHSPDLWNYVNSRMGTYKGYATYWTSSQGYQNQLSGFYTVLNVGYLQVSKGSSNTSVTNGYSQYQTSGARFGVYNSAGAQVATLTTGAGGTVTSGALTVGTYTVRELSAPTGYNLNAGTWTVNIASGATTTLNVLDAPITGYVVLNKRSGSTSVTAGNPNYSLAGAVYGVYTDAACTQIAYDLDGNAVYLTTDADGNTQSSGQLRYGPYYYMKEITASPGYDLDPTVYTIALTTGTVTVTVNEQPHTDPMWMIKVDQDTYDPATWTLADNKPQGSATLEGAQFTVLYYYEHYDSLEDIVAAAQTSGDYATAIEAMKAVAERIWIFATDSRGLAMVDDAWFISGDELYRDAYGYATVPIGTMVVFESKAPHGYILPEDVYHITWITMTEDSEVFISEDEVVHNYVDTLKRDIDSKTPIADTEITLYRLVNDLVAIDDDNVLTVADGADLDDESNWITVGAWFTDADGIVDLGKVPIGYYRLLETYPSASGEYMSRGETVEDGAATTVLYPVFFTVDSTTEDSVQVFEDRKIEIEAKVDKVTIRITSIGFAYADDRYNEVDNTGSEQMRYDVGYDAGKSNTYGDEYWVIDNCEFAASPYDLRVTELYLPVTKGDTDGMLWLLVRTNLTDLLAGTAFGMNFSQPGLHPGTLCDGTARFVPVGWDFWGQFSATARAIVNLADFLDLDAGEYITGICIVHGAVEKDFATLVPLTYMVKATHQLPAGTVIPNSATSHISRNWSSTLHTPDGDEDKEPGGLRDDDADAVETRVVATFTTEFERGLGEWADGYSYGHRYLKHTYYTRSFYALPATGDVAALACEALAGIAFAALALAALAAAGRRRERS